MIKVKSFAAAFALIEMLVVITLVGILASVAVPVFNSVQLRGQQTKCLTQAKQIGLALKLFAAEHNGSYPVYSATGAVGSGKAAGLNSANQDFGCLFPKYTQSKAIFANPFNFYDNVVADNVIDAAGTPDVKTLAAGECAYSYIEGLKDTFNPACPVLCDAVPVSGVYTTTINQPGYDWGTNKAMVIHLDNSGGLDTLTGPADNMTDQQKDPSESNSTLCNYIVPSSNKALGPTCFLVAPVRK